MRFFRVHTNKFNLGRNFKYDITNFVTSQYVSDAGDVSKLFCKQNVCALEFVFFLTILVDKIIILCVLIFKF